MVVTEKKVQEARKEKEVKEVKEENVLKIPRV